MWRLKARIIDFTYKGPNETFLRTSITYNCWLILAVDQGSFYYGAGNEKGKATFGDLGNTICGETKRPERYPAHF